MSVVCHPRFFSLGQMHPSQNCTPVSMCFQGFTNEPDILQTAELEHTRSGHQNRSSEPQECLLVDIDLNSAEPGTHLELTRLPRNTPDLQNCFQTLHSPERMISKESEIITSQNEHPLQSAILRVDK